MKIPQTYFKIWSPYKNKFTELKKLNKKIKPLVYREFTHPLLQFRYIAFEKKIIIPPGRRTHFWK